MKLEEFCAPFEKLFMVTEKMLFHEAITFCKIHDGYLYSPSSEEKNQQFLSMLKEKNDECVIPNIGHTEGTFNFSLKQKVIMQGKLISVAYTLRTY